MPGTVPDVPHDANCVAGPIVAQQIEPGAPPSPIPLSGHISATGSPIEIERGTVGREGVQKRFIKTRRGGSGRRKSAYPHLHQLSIIHIITHGMWMLCIGKLIRTILRCSVPHPAWRSIPSNPIHSLLAPRCYIHLRWRFCPHCNDDDDDDDLYIIGAVCVYVCMSRKG